MAGKRLLLVASTTGYQTRMFAEAAAGLGIAVSLATDRCHVLDNPWGDHSLPIRFDEPEASVRTAVESGPFDGIVALGDKPAAIAALIAEALGLPFHSSYAVAACRDKYLARRRFQAAGLPVPGFYRAPFRAGAEAAAEQAVYPCVLKPLSLSASRGVIRADSRPDFLAAFRRIEVMLRGERDEFLQVERFIPGREFALEGIVTAGHLQVLALFDKPDPLDGPFFEETIYVTPSRQPRQVREAIGAAAQAAVAALGLNHGPVHAEMRVNDAGVWMLEVAARPIGGLCARVLPGLPELILQHACGEDVSGFSFAGRAAGVMMIPIPRAGIYQGVTGADDLEDVVITAKQGQQLVPLPEGSSYLGFIFAAGTDPAAVEETLRQQTRPLGVRHHSRSAGGLSSLIAGARSRAGRKRPRRRSSLPSA